MADAPDKLYVTNPKSGKVEVHPNTPESISNLSRLGYTAANDDQLHQHDLAQEYGGIKGAAIAGLTGAASTGTFGISDQLLKGNEAVQASQEQHPLVHGAGEALGLLNPLGPEGMAVKAAGEVGEHLAGRAVGKVFLKAAEGPLTEAGVGALEAPGAVAKAVTAAGRGAAEAVPFSVGHTIKEQDLGDLSTLPEHLIANMGSDALAFGSAGAGLSVLGSVAKPIIGKARQALTDLSDSASEPVGQPMSPPDANKAQREFRENLQGSYDGVGEARRNLIENQRPVDREALLSEADPGKAAAHAQQTFADGQKTLQSMEGGAQVGQFNPAMVKKFEINLLAYERTALHPDATPHDIYLAGDELRARVGDSMAGGGMDPAVQATQEQLGEFYKPLKDGLTDESVYGPQGAAQAKINDALHAQSVDSDNFFRKMAEDIDEKNAFKPGKVISPSKVASYMKGGVDAGNDLKRELFDKWTQSSHNLLDVSDEVAARNGMEADKVTNDGLRALLKQTADSEDGLVHVPEQQAAYDQAMKPPAPKPEGPISILANMVPGVERVRAGLDKLGKLWQGANGTALRYGYMKGVAMQGAAAIDKGLAALGKVAEPAGRAVRAGAAIASDNDPVATYKKNMETVQKLSDPETMMHHATAIQGDLAKDAPTVAAGVAAAVARVVESLNNQLHIPVIPGMFAPKWMPSNGEAHKFNSSFKLAMDPIGQTMKHLKAGSLTPLHVQVLNGAFPGIKQQIVTKLVDHLSSMKDVTKLPYKQRLASSLLIGAPMDGTMSPPFIRGNAAVYAQASGGRGSQGGGTGQVAGNAMLKQAGQFSTKLSRLQGPRK